MNNEKRVMTLNVISTIVLQIITLICGFFIPYIVLHTFGSKINGLVVSVTQFLNYISLLEGGVSAVILANLYKPLVDSNKEKLNKIIAATNKFFRTLAIIFLAYQLFLSIFYPLIVKNDGFSWLYIFTLTQILGIGIFVQYYFAITWKLLLQADKKVYISSIIQGIVMLLNLLVTLIMVKYYPDIHLVKLISGIIFFIQPVLYDMYIKKHYKIDKTSEYDSSMLSQRWDGFGINLAAMVHGSTSIVILTFMTNLNIVSVFSVYFMIAVGLKTLITSISMGITPSLGHYYAGKDAQKLLNLFNIYEFIMFMVSFYVFIIASFSVGGFVNIYAKNINDINYYCPLLGLILMLAECMFCVREPYINLAYIAGKFNDISKYAYIEAIINIVLSIILVYYIGFIGVAIGLLISILYRNLRQVKYTSKYLLKRSIKKFYKMLGIYLLIFFIAEIIFFYYGINEIKNIYEFIYNCLLATIVLLPMLIIGGYMIAKKEFKEIIQFMLR